MPESSLRHRLRFGSKVAEWRLLLVRKLSLMEFGTEFTFSSKESPVEQRRFDSMRLPESRADIFLTTLDAQFEVIPMPYFARGWLRNTEDRSRGAFLVG
jgi:hypothetical protein